ncbi:MAG TPA: ferrous iron transport protein B, partial [Tepidisphaeraceae bacterium]
SRFTLHVSRIRPMPTCHDPTHASASPAKPGTLTVALAGNPNSGKTTIFNALTGLRQKVANYPGVTVEKKVGRCKLPDGAWCEIIDLPGTYSLISRSPDEQVAMEVLRGIRKDVKTPDVVIVVVDASNLQRNLYLVSQLIELGRPLVVALNMTDVAERRGLIVSVEKLQSELGVPVVPVVGYKRKGIPELKEAIRKAEVAPLPHWELPDPMREELLVVGGGLAILDSREGEAPAEPNARSTEDAGSAGASPSQDTEDVSPVAPRAWICRCDDNDRRLDRFEALAERLLIGDSAADILPLRQHEPVASLVSHATSRLRQLGIDPMQADVEAHYQWIESVAHRVVTSRDELGAAPASDRVLSYARPKPKNITEQVDAIFIHRLWGLLVFALIMGTLFVSIFWLAKPIMDGIQNGINALGTLVAGHMSDGPLRDLVKDGIFAGVGTVVVFVPQIAMLFLFLSLLEDSGYLARAAFLMDRLLSKVGLHGKSFIPLLSSFACAIPGIMATRTIENRRERLATILVAPFMSCSARLPVYTLLIGAFFATLGPLKQAGIMLACYALGILAAAGTAFAFKRTLTKGPATSFILELPSYKIPQLSQVARQVWTNTKAFLTKAGTTIFCLSVILWAMAYYPRLPGSQAARIRAATLPDARIAAYNAPTEEYAKTHGNMAGGRGLIMYPAAAKQDPKWLSKLLSPEEEADAQSRVEHAVAAAQAEYSLSGRLGHAIEPVLRPLGFDWKIDIGLISAFAAREVFVSSMGIVYSVGDVEEGGTANLSAAMQNDRYASGPHAGRPVWTPMVAISLLVWFVLAMQCMSTFAIVRRETGGWGWPIFMLVYMNVLAYVVSLIVYQVGSRVFA